MQKIRVKFSRGEKIKFISHLDITRLWERALRRSGVPLTYSQGFSPHPQISLAVPLSVGMTSEAELMDVVCDRPVTPQWFEGALSQQLPDGISITLVQAVAAQLPSLQSQVRFAEYRVLVKTEKTREEIEDMVNHLMSLKTLTWQHQRDTGAKTYDLRALVALLMLLEYEPGSVTLGMRLRSDNLGSGRPEQVTAALGFTQYPDSIHRTALILEPINNAGNERPAKR
jgi:radical SAM-linked protein